jgi:hypothetical protein
MYALSQNKTTTHYLRTHWCRRHNQFLKGEHLATCDVIRSINFPNDPPTKYNEVMNRKGHLFSSLKELQEMNHFYGSIKQTIADAEEAGLLIVTDQMRRFPKVKDKIYEPIDHDWICTPDQCKPSQQQHLNAITNCRPITSC